MRCDIKEVGITEYRVAFVEICIEGNENFLHIRVHILHNTLHYTFLFSVTHIIYSRTTLILFNHRVATTPVIPIRVGGLIVRVGN